MPDEYISREAAVNIAFNAGCEAGDDGDVNGAEALQELALCLRKLPAADVVEVVRCKDCEHRIKRAFYANVVYCGRAGMKVMALNDFCSKGAKGWQAR